MSKAPLCYAPFIGMFSSEKGYAPCCVVRAKFNHTSPDEYWKSGELVDFRKQMFENKLPLACSVCKRNINRGLNSDLSFWKHQYATNPISINVESGNQTNVPLVVDFRPGNRCNLKCRMCGPNSSDQIEREINQNPLLEEFFTITPQQSFDLERTIEYMREKKFDKVKVLGGEPSIDPVVIEFLEALDPLTKIEITTNATSMNKSFMSALKRYPNLHLTFSVDATGPTFEYIRTNARWDIVSYNVEKFLDLGIARSYRFNVVLMPYNIFNLKDLILWFRTLRNNRHRFDIYYSDSDSVKTSLSNVKPHHMEQVIDELVMLKDAEAYKLIDILTNIQYHDHNFAHYNNVLDLIRKTKLTDLDIRFKEYI